MSICPPFFVRDRSTIDGEDASFEDLPDLMRHDRLVHVSPLPGRAIPVASSSTSCKSGGRRDELHAPAVARMREREPCRVKKRALQARHRADIAGHAPVHAAVQRIADDRMADRAEVDADLVRASGVNRDLAQRQRRACGARG